MRLHRRGFMSLTTGLALTACSRTVRAEGTYSIVDTGSEIALSPDGQLCAVQSSEEGINTILLAKSDLSDAILISLPAKNYWIRDLSFCDDGSGLLFTAGPPQFDRDVKIYKLDPETQVAAIIETGQTYNRFPVISPDGRKMAFVSGSAYGVLHVYEMDLPTGRVEPYSDAPFNFFTALTYRPDGSLVVNGLPGRDPYETREIDKANGYQRVFLLERDGFPDSSLLAAFGASNLALCDVYEGQLLLSVRHDPPSGRADIRLALSDREVTTLRYIDTSDFKGEVITGAAISGPKAILAMRGPSSYDDNRVEMLAIQGYGSISISDIAARSARSIISF